MSNSVQKKLFSDKSQILHSTTPQLINLFMPGMQCLEILINNEDWIRFSQWAKLLKESGGEKEALDLKKLEWLWKSITSEPNIRKLLGSRIISLDDEWKKLEPVECVPSDSRFGIFFKNFNRYGTPVLSLPTDLKPNAEAVIHDPLYMQPGKARRLECRDVATTLEIYPDKLGPRNVEAANLKVNIEDIEIKKGCIYVAVESLNHAYTKASLRLEPQRRSHGGRAYDHVALKIDNRYKPLETIRKEHEKQLWDILIKK